MRDLIAGAGYLLAGFRLVFRPRVRLFALVPLLVNTLIFAGAIVAGASMLGTFIDHLTEQWAWAGWIAWLLWPLFVLVALLLLFFVFSVFANLLAAPFNGFLARAVEISLTGNAVEGDARTLAAEMLAALHSELCKLRFFALRALPLLLLFLVPLVQAVAPVLWLLFGMWVLSLEYVEYPMGNHGMGFERVRSLAAERRSLTLGFGGAALLLTLIPVLNFVAMPVAVAGATRMWVEKLKPGHSA